ncbi:hypothetical protein N7540_005940 [Penicillium herquei]|nr:hypothetical protein N7540_005940 [Penicillium herquei]
MSLSDKEAWEQIRKELQSVGMTPRAFEKNRAFILQVLEKAISEGDLLAAFEPGSQSNESASESIEPESTAAITYARATLPQLRLDQPPVSIKAEENRQISKPVTSTPAKRSNRLSRLVYRLIASKDKFIQAAADGDLSSVMRSLDMNVDVDSHNWEGESALMKAAGNGHERIVEVLVAHGAARKACSGTKRDCNTALYNAAAKGYTRIIELILEGGGTSEWNREWLGYRPASPLAVAASSAQLDSVQVLMENGASVKTIDGNGESEALLRASAAGHANIVRCLLEKGARIDGSTSRGRTALSQAISYQQDTMVTLLLSKRASVNMRDEELCTYLHLALADELDADVKGSKQLAIVKALLEHGAGKIVNAFNAQQETPLFLAITRGASETARLLLEKWGDQNLLANDKRNTSALQHAVQRQSKSMVLMLLKNKAHPNERNGNEETPLFDAVKMNNIEIAQLLLQHGAYLDAQDKSGDTVLFFAVRERFFSMVSFLLSKGADPNLKNQQGISATHDAVMDDFTSTALIRLLLQNGADPNLKSNHGEPLIFHALRAPRCSHSNLDRLDGVFDLLLTSGADPNSTDRVGKTILVAAIRAGLYSIVEILLGHGADVNLRDKTTWTTPLVSSYMDTRTSETYRISSLLKRHGAI